MVSRLRLLTLDLTGTVFRFRKPPFVQYQEMAAAYGVDTDVDNVRKGFLTAWKTLNKSFPHFGSTTHGDSRTWWHELVHDVMRGKSIDDANAAIKLTRTKPNSN